eukprot:GHVU01148560.1.p3 GENE.GHVU01148560.1~~GHVU01148560.1.p3  ORF type:complete len:129 (-),score=1.63 GHVU01148560.1:897-1283(-)
MHSSTNRAHTYRRCPSIGLHTDTDIHMHARTNACTHVHTYTHVRTNACTHAHMYALAHPNLRMGRWNAVGKWRLRWFRCLRQIAASWPEQQPTKHVLFGFVLFLPLSSVCRHAPPPRSRAFLAAVLPL